MLHCRTCHPVALALEAQSKSLHVSQRIKLFFCRWYASSRLDKRVHDPHVDKARTRCPAPAGGPGQNGLALRCAVQGHKQIPDRTSIPNVTRRPDQRQGFVSLPHEFARDAPKQHPPKWRRRARVVKHIRVSRFSALKRASSDAASMPRRTMSSGAASPAPRRSAVTVASNGAIAASGGMMVTSPRDAPCTRARRRTGPSAASARSEPSRGTAILVYIIALARRGYPKSSSRAASYSSPSANSTTRSPTSSVVPS